MPAPRCFPTPEALLSHLDPQQPLWVFGYASLIWRPEFDYAEQRPARTHGWHRSLCMWSRVNRGTPELPGLVFALVRGGSCQGMVYRLPEGDRPALLQALWAREMPRPVYEPRLLPCLTPQGPIQALAFTLPQDSPSLARDLSAEQYRTIFSHARGIFGTTHEYAQRTHEALHALGIRDRALERLLHLATAPAAQAVPVRSASPALPADPAPMAPSTHGTMHA